MNLTIAGTGYVGRSNAVLLAQHNPEFYRSKVVNDLEEFKRRADVIVANRRSPDLESAAGKIYTRDLFGSD